MRTYEIMTDTIEQNERLLEKLMEYVDKGDIDMSCLNVKPRLFGDGKRYEFKCEKSVWKKLKKTFDLKITDVLSVIKEEA